MSQEIYVSIYLAVLRVIVKWKWLSVAKQNVGMSEQQQRWAIPNRHSKYWYTFSAKLQIITTVVKLNLSHTFE